MTDTTSSTTNTVTEVLDVVDTVMTKIGAIAQLPGLNIIPYASVASSVINTVHAAYEAGKDILPYLEAIKETFTGDGVPTQTDLDALNAKIAILEAQVETPLPPPDTGEPD